MNLYDRVSGTPARQITMQDVQQDPVGIGREKGYQIPDNLATNPQAMVMHLLQTGQVNPPMLQKIRPLLQRLGFK